MPGDGAGALRCSKPGELGPSGGLDRDVKGRTPGPSGYQVLSTCHVPGTMFKHLHVFSLSTFTTTYEKSAIISPLSQKVKLRLREVRRLPKIPVGHRAEVLTLSSGCYFLNFHLSKCR